MSAAATDELAVTPTAQAFAVIDDERLLEVIPKLTGLDLLTESDNDPFVGLSPSSVVMASQPWDVSADGPAADVDLLIGNNTEEGQLYLSLDCSAEESTMDDCLGDRGSRALRSPPRCGGAGGSTAKRDAG